MRENAKNKSATVNRKMTVLKSFFSWAVRHQLVDSNPTTPYNRSQKDDSNISWRYLSSDERTRLLLGSKWHYKANVYYSYTCYEYWYP